jgi:hypothetical protein
MPVTIDLLGYEEIQAVLSKLHGRKAEQALGTISEGIGRELINVLQEYPARRYGAKQEFSSAAQRRGFFAALNSGRIRVPYRRRMDLGRSWDVERRGSGAVVGTKALYAPYVQSEERQTKMHERTGWTTDEQAVDKVKKTGVIPRIAKKVLGKLMR